MKTNCGIIHLSAFAFLMSVLGAGAAYPKYQPFDSGTTSGWESAVAYLTNVAAASGSAIALPGATGGSVLSNGTDAADITGTKVWTDYRTRPVAHSPAGLPAPEIDANATVQFYVNSSGRWVVHSGNGGGGYLTNELTTVLGSDAAYPTVAIPATSYYRVSVLSDYTAKTFSFFVEGKCLATNLAFMCDPVAATRWFQVKNLSEQDTSVCLLDEYWLTNSLRGVLTEQITGGGITLADALYYFGTVSPRAPSTNTAASGTTVTWALNVLGNQLDPFLVQGGAAPGSYTTVAHDNVALLADNKFNSTDLSGANKYFYRVIRKSLADTSVTITNTEVYAAYKQTRQRYRSYLVGVPVIPLGSDATLAGPIGTQLAKGLTAGDLLTVYEGGAAKVFVRGAGLSWSTQSGDKQPGQITFATGMGVLIQVVNDNSGDSNTILAGVLQTSATDLPLTAGAANIVAWPYETAGSLSSAFDGTHTADNTASGYLSGDYAWIQRQGTINPIAARYTASGWAQYFNKVDGTDLDGLQLQAGDGVFVKPVGGALRWKRAAP